MDAEFWFVSSLICPNYLKENITHPKCPRNIYLMNGKNKYEEKKNDQE